MGWSTTHLQFLFWKCWEQQSCCLPANFWDLHGHEPNSWASKMFEKTQRQLHWAEFSCQFVLKNVATSGSDVFHLLCRPHFWVPPRGRRRREVFGWSGQDPFGAKNYERTFLGNVFCFVSVESVFRKMSFSCLFVSWFSFCSGGFQSGEIYLDGWSTVEPSIFEGSGFLGECKGTQPAFQGHPVATMWSTRLWKVSSSIDVSWCFCYPASHIFVGSFWYQSSWPEAKWKMRTVSLNMVGKYWSNAHQTDSPKAMCNRQIEHTWFAVTSLEIFQNLIAGHHSCKPP